MKTLIVYSSQTGNTRKLAEAANDLLNGEKQLCHIDQAPDPEDFDLIVLGFWLKGGKPDPKSSEYLSKVGSSKLFLLATHGASPDSDHAKAAMQNAMALAPLTQIVGTFSCQGEVEPSFLEKVRRKNPPPPWSKDAPQAVGHPTVRDIEKLKASIRDALPGYVV